MEKQIEYTAEEFVRALQATPVVIEYMEALSKVENNEEITNLTEKYYSLSAEFQKKQYEGTLTQEEITEMRSLVNSIRSHPLENEIRDKQALLIGVLQECNDEISSVLNMDFAKIAAPPSSCEC